MAVAAVIGVVLVVAFAGARPADAHVGGVQPGDFVVTIDRIQPPVPGLSLRVRGFVGSLELHAPPGRTTVVLGYEGEPYLRVDPDGRIERNRRSPATYLNVSASAPGAVPKSARADLAPEWERIGSGGVVAWHDHRAHYMGGRVAAASLFVVQLRIDGRTVLIAGTLHHDPGPAPWPWLVGSVLVAAIVVAAARHAWRPVLATTLGLLCVSEVVHGVGAAVEAGNRGASAAGAFLLPVVGVFVSAAAAAIAVRRRDERASAPWALFGGLVPLFLGGVGDLSTLWHSQIPSSLAPDAARAFVVLALGLGLGVVVAALPVAWRAPEPLTPAPAEPDAPVTV